MRSWGHRGVGVKELGSGLSFCLLIGSWGQVFPLEELGSGLSFCLQRDGGFGARGSPYKVPLRVLLLGPERLDAARRLCASGLCRSFA
jgi:hypothetical protein